MDKKVLILHGWGGSNYPHWQSWLACEMVKNYGSVNFLKFDNYDFPDKTSWKNQLIKEFNDFNPDIVVCHSVANILWFHLCNEGMVEQIKKLFLVAVPSLKLQIEELSSFYPCEIPTNLYADQSVLVGSTNDPYMDINEFNLLQKTFNIEVKLLTDAGHINVDSGFGEWEWILQEIQK